MKLGLALLGLLPTAVLEAQSLVSQQSFERALTVRDQWAGSGYAPADLRLSSAYTDANGLEHVYVQQLFRGIPVYNRVQSLAFMRGRLASHTGNFLPAKQLAVLPTAPAITAAVAVSRTLQHLARPFAAVPTQMTEESGPEARKTFAATGVAQRDIVASLTWASDQAGRLYLAWNVNIDLLNSADWWNVRVDAATGAIIGQDNWTVSETAARPAAGTAAHRAALALTKMTAPNKAAAANAWLLPPTTTSSSFLVVPFPLDRPGSTGLQTETDPWLKAGPTNNATTHGWNFDGTTNYDITRGNNVSAYDDAANINAPGNFATSQTAAPSLSFNYTPNFATTPSTVANRNAAVVNLFYWNNIVHDVLYQYGFTEAAGNFQADNIGRGGRGKDFVVAEAQDGKGTNNANFETPPDGTSGRMQMYLWSPPTQAYNIQVTAPASVAGSYPAVESGFSTANKLANLGPISGQLGLFTDAGSNPVTSLACGTHAGAPLTGKIAFLYRGTCTFVTKVKNAQLAGAIAAIVVTNTALAPVVMGGTDNTITIPAVLVSQADGAKLAAQVAAGVQVTLPRVASLPQLDGDFDNGIMVHEYGHGVSNRLTGGPAASSCLDNEEQAGEGWSDYLALMLTTNWTTAKLTDGPSARPMATYAAGEAATGGGIRRYPYSTSLTTNPLTYADVTPTPEVHAIGEIWCAALWDMTWGIIQKQGRIEPNLYSGMANGGNNVALQLVMQGLKLQPCQPGFLDSRDAILAADSLLYHGQYHCTIWSAFARRGMGYSAKQGSSGSATDQKAAFDMPPAVTLAKSAPVVAGSTFSNEYQLTCNCQVPNAAYTVTDELPTGMQFVSSSTGGTLVGNKVTFSNLTFTTPGQTRTLRFVAQATAPTACAPAMPINDNRDASLVGGFTSQNLIGNTNWSSSIVRANTGTHAWRAPALATATDLVLTSQPFTPTGLSVLSFYHYYEFEGSADGGTVELSDDSGVNWVSPETLWVQNGYNSIFAPSTSAPGEACFSGQSGPIASSFIRSVLDLRSFAGKSLLLRFRVRTDVGSPANFLGWFIDDIQVLNGCGGTQLVELSNGTVQSSQKVLTYLLPGAVTAQQAGLAQSSEFSAQPNPFGAQGLQLHLNLPSAQPQVALGLYDVAGRLLLRRSLERVAAGTSTLNWTEAAGLPAGLYLVRIQLPDGSSRTLRVARE